MIKNLVKFILQKLFGFQRYLYIFSVFIIKKLPWDKNEGDFIHFLKLIPNEGTLLDIGANIGVMSYYLAKRKPNAKVIAFEPLKVNYTNLEKLIQKYKLNNIRVEKYALGDESGEVEMVMPVVNSAKLHGLSHVVHESINEYNEGSKYKVPIFRLDDINCVNDAEHPVKAIKIDVENFEYFVLKGGIEMLKRDAPIVYAELWECENRISTFDLFKSLNYTIKVVENNNLVKFTDQKTQNFIFVPN